MTDTSALGALRSNLPEYSVSRNLGALEAHGRAEFRLCARARRDLGLQAPFLRPLLSRLERRRGGAGRGDLAHDGAASGPQARRRHGSHLRRQADHLSRPLEISARDRERRAGRHRRAAEAAGRSQEKARSRRPVRRGPQTKLPYLPDIIGVVTSPTGAVIRDILHRLADRFPRRVLVWPVAVQGEGGGRAGRGAIAGFNALHPAARCRGPIC